MRREYQVTLLCATGQYRPVSTIVTKEQNNIIDLTTIPNSKEMIKQEGIKKICQKRGWTERELKQYSYTRIKVRYYDRELIAKEKQEKYEKIKETHYQDGTWKRPITREENDKV